MTVVITSTSILFTQTLTHADDHCDFLCCHSEQSRALVLVLSQCSVASDETLECSPQSEQDVSLVLCPISVFFSKL